MFFKKLFGFLVGKLISDPNNNGKSFSYPWRGYYFFNRYNYVWFWYSLTKTFFLFSYFRGHNVRKVEDKAVSSTLGKVDVVDKLVIVKPLKSRFLFYFELFVYLFIIYFLKNIYRYHGEVGDVVVGRVVEVYT